MVGEFHHYQNLRHHSFKGKTLLGADFSHADIRGTNFTGATLINAKFSHALAGLPFCWRIGLSIALLLLVALVGFISGFTGTFVGGGIVVIACLTGRFILISFVVLLLVGLGVITVFQGLGTALWTFALVIVTSAAVMIAYPSTSDMRALAILLELVLAVNVASIICGAIATATTRILIGRWMAGVVGVVVFAAVTVGMIAGIEETKDTARLYWSVSVAVPETITLVSLSLFVGWRSIAGDKKYALIRLIAVRFCSWGSTSFRGANLTDVDFSGASLKNADFRLATLTRTCWFQAKHLDQARTEGTYLEHPQIRQLVTSKNGQDQNFNHLDLRELNLEGANLTDASLVGTRLSETTLRNANLTRATLVQAQLYGADLTGACLTGAIIENWGISTDTKFEGVHCEYIYMHRPTKTDPDPCRKPDNRNEVFKEGDFADFITPIIKTLDLYQSQHIDPRNLARRFKTLDLYHYEGIDPSAAAIALKQLAEQYPEAGLQVVALEGRGDEKIRLQATVAGMADRSQLSDAYFAKYQELVALPNPDLQALLMGIAEKDERIRSLEQMVMTAISSQKFYVETYYRLGDDRSVSIGGNVTEGTIQTGDENAASIENEAG